MVGILDPACELLPPWTKELYLCTVAPLPSLWPPPPLPPSQTNCTVYTDSVWLWGGMGGGGVLNCAVDHILQEFYTLLLTRFRTYKISLPPQTKWPVKTTLRDWCLESSFVHVYIILSPNAPLSRDKWERGLQYWSAEQGVPAHRHISLVNTICLAYSCPGHAGLFQRRWKVERQRRRLLSLSGSVSVSA